MSRISRSGGGKRSSVKATNRSPPTHEYGWAQSGQFGQSGIVATNTRRAKLRYGIPDVELRCARGGTLNPADFAGHLLVVLFCPLPPASAREELADYRSRSREFRDNDAWLLSIADDWAGTVEKRCEALASDPEGTAWVAFDQLSSPERGHARDEGAAFVFGRGGSMQGAYFGRGHAQEVVQSLSERA